MSGVAGIFYRNGRPVDLEILKPMGKALGHRGPDGISHYSSKNIGFVHCMLRDTPESFLESLPYRSADTGKVITWHGRIDNREELSNKTGWSRPLATTPDSDLILAAYEKWESDCVDHLLGDFAFVIWDERKQKLFCARDHMGINPFYYALTDDYFAFASEIKGLFAIPGLEGEVNEERIADYLTCIATETKSTFYKNIFRLSPGHFLEIDSDRSRCHCYWEPRPAVLVCRSSKEYEQQFYDIFADAVRCRLRSSFPAGSFLSGGMDSSSIVCMAAGPLRDCLPSPLHTFSGIFDELTKCDERKYFQSVLDRYEVVPHFVNVDRIDPGRAYDNIMETEDEPFWAPHFFMLWELMALARGTGIRILLDGHDGDNAVSYGLGLLSELFMKGKWFRLAKECRGLGNTPSLKKTFKNFLCVCRDCALIRFSSFLPATTQKYNFIETVVNLNPSFVRQTDINNRLTQAEAKRAKQGQPEYLRHKLAIMQPTRPLALEFLERLNIQHRLVGRYPFFAKYLVEFCLALPSEQKFSHGYTRNIVRSSLRNILPEAIAGRKSKTNFTPSMTNAFSTSGRRWLSFRVDRLNKSVYNYVDSRRFLRIYNLFLNSPSEVTFPELGYILRTISLAQWL